MKRLILAFLVVIAMGCTSMGLRHQDSSLSPQPEERISVVTPHPQAPASKDQSLNPKKQEKGENLEEELYMENLCKTELTEEISRGSDMGVSINREVKRFLEYYRGKGKRTFLRYWQRGERFMPLVKRILRKERLPEDLAYLPILESGYWATALSHSRALGYWQFIKSTARLYGLRIDPWVDERMDIEKSTKAAAHYLKELHARLGSWELAIAAYNAGPISIERAIKKTGSRDFWVLAHSHYLRKETKEYVPRFMAILLLVHNPNLYGLSAPDPPPPLTYEVVKVKGMVNLKSLASLSGLSYHTLRKLNPALKHWVTPPGPPYPLKVPVGTGKRVARIVSNPRYAGILYPVPDRHGNKWIKHRLTRGESLYLLAKEYGVPLSTLVAVNGIRNPRLIRSGKVILIPASINLWAKRRRIRRIKRKVQKRRGEAIYVVQEGDSLWSIARSFSVGVRDLKRRNGLKGNRIKPGETLVIPHAVPPIKLARAGRARHGTITYRVKKGDNLWSIARSFSVDVKDLKRWNGLKRNLLHPGKTLVIYASGKGKGDREKLTKDDKS